MSTQLEARPEGCLSDSAIDRIVAGEPSPSGADEHLATCASCRSRLEAITRERDAFLASSPSAPKGAPRRARVYTIATAACGALALAAVLFLLVRTKPSPEDGTPSTRLKGASRIGFYVKRGSSVTLGAAGERVRPGDALRFVYTSAEPRYLAIFSLDGARHASVYYPDAAQAATLAPAAVDRPLDTSTVLDDTLGSERLFGVFCVEAITLEPVRSALETTGAPPARADCTVDTIEIRKE